MFLQPLRDSRHRVVEIYVDRRRRIQIRHLFPARRAARLLIAELSASGSRPCNGYRVYAGRRSSGLTTGNRKSREIKIICPEESYMIVRLTSLDPRAAIPPCNDFPAERKMLLLSAFSQLLAGRSDQHGRIIFNKTFLYNELF